MIKKFFFMAVLLLNTIIHTAQPNEAAGLRPNEREEERYPTGGLTEYDFKILADFIENSLTAYLDAYRANLAQLVKETKRRFSFSRLTKVNR